MSRLTPEREAEIRAESNRWFGVLRELLAEIDPLRAEMPELRSQIEAEERAEAAEDDFNARQHVDADSLGER